MKRLLLVLAGLAVWAGCSEDPVDSRTPEVFQGLMVMTPQFNSDPMEIYPDSVPVTFTVEGALYDLVQAEASRFELCDSRGTVQGFGTNTATLTPTGLISSANCDSIHIPKGTFAAVFRVDSLYLGPKKVGYVLNVNGTPTVDSMTFYFKLRQVQ